MNRVLLLSNLLLQKRQQMLPSIKRYFFAGVLFTLMLFAANAVKAQLYWNTNNILDSVRATNWSLVSGGPIFTTAWSNSSNIVFTANSKIQYITISASPAPPSPPIGNLSIINNSTVTWTPVGTYTTGGGIRTFDIGAGSTLNWNGQTISVVAGTGFVKNSAGTWNVGTQSNAYPGGFTMNAGTVTFSGNNVFGSGTLVLNGGIITPSTTNARIIPSLNITIGGNFQLGDAVNFVGGTGNVTFSNAVTLGAATRTVTIGGVANYTFGGAIGSTGGGLTIAATPGGAGKIILTNASTYTGATTINSGTLQASLVNNCLPNTALVFANTAGAIFNGNGLNQTVGSIAGGGALGGNITMGAGNLSTGGANSNTSYGGVISGTGTFTKTGSGTQLLGGGNTYTGATTVSGGGLFINGSTNSLSTLSLAGGVTIGGSGTFPNTVSLPATTTISPGGADASTGTFNTGALTFAIRVSM